MNPLLIRRTLRGAVIGALLFGGIALFQALRTGAPFPRVLQPILVLAVIGLTVGALAGPLVSQAIARLRSGDG